MKLHLPKPLFTALLAVLTLAVPAAWGASQSTTVYVDKTTGKAYTTDTIEGLTLTSVTATVYSGSTNNNINLSSYDSDSTVVMAMTDSGDQNYFNDASWETSATLIIGQQDANGGAVSGGMYINNGYTGSFYDFNGVVQGAGTIKKSGKGTINLCFSADMSKYTGEIQITDSSLLVFNGATTGTGSISSSSSAGVIFIDTVINNSSISVVNGASFFGSNTVAGNLNITSAVRNFGLLRFDDEGTLTVSNGNEWDLSDKNYMLGAGWDNGITTNGVKEGVSAGLVVILGGMGVNADITWKTSDETTVTKTLVDGAISDGTTKDVYAVVNNATLADINSANTDNLSIAVKEGVTLTKGSADTTNALLGSGIYDLGSSTSLGGAVIGHGWCGTVAISNNSVVTDLNANTYGHAGSSVKLSGLTGWLNGATVATNLILENDTYTHALKVDNGSNGATHSFGGRISGSGDLILDQKSTVNNNTFVFTGDISEWARESDTDIPEIIVGGTNHTKNYNVTLQGAANTVNVSMKKADGHTGTFTLNVQTAGDATFAEAIAVDALNINRNAAFNNALIVNRAAEVSAGRTLTLGGGSAETPVTHSIGTLSAANASVTLGDYATLTLGGGTAETPVTHSIGTLTGGTGSMLNLAEHSVLNTITSASGVTLTGSGLYELQDDAITMTSGVSLSGNWTGTVKMSNVAYYSGNQVNNNKMETMASTAGSGKLMLTNVNGWLGTGTMSKHLILENGTGGEAALYLSNGSSADNSTKTATFSGGISGTGDIQFNWNKTGVTNCTLAHTISGDTASWSGKFISNESGSLDVQVDFTEGGEVFSSTVDGGGVENRTDNKLTVNVGSSGTATSFNGSIGKTSGAGAVELNVTHNNVTFNKAVNVDKLTVAQGASAQLGNTLTVDSVSFSAGESATAESPAKLTGKSTSALAQLQEDASFTIQDMTLTNTTITAATPTTQVNFINVTVAGATVLRNMQASMTGANVATGGSEGVKGVFTASTSLLSGITLANMDADGSTIVVDLGDLSCAASMGPGKYDLRITLSDFNMQDYTQGIVFAADSWLGQLLTAQGATAYVSGAVETPASVSEGGTGGVSVSYSAATGGNEGTVITISGLNVPEPASATLGLAALMMLCSRRRRND